MIQHGATVCIREVVLGGLLIQMEKFVSADLGIVMLLPEGLDWGWIPDFRADGCVLASCLLLPAAGCAPGIYFC